MYNSHLIPVIFCHYGITNYLELTLLAAKISNPKKNVFLLGDKSNLSLAKKVGVTHIDFNQFDSFNSVLSFNSNFKFIAGKKHGRSEWTKFVFLRWFYVNEFVIKNNIKSFWHFDSDNLIVSDLSQLEERFILFDNTEQCNGICLNGFISSNKITQLYTKHIIDLFNDDKYIDEQKLKCVNNPSFAFTEMAAYNDFKKKYNLNTKRLHCEECENTFDDCLASSDGMEQSNELYNGYIIKSIYMDRKNLFYFKNQQNKKYIKVNSFNLSWMPYSLILRLFCLFCRSKFPYFIPFFNFRNRNYIKVELKSYSLLDRLLDKFVSKIIKLKYW